MRSYRRVVGSFEHRSRRQLALNRKRPVEVFRRAYGVAQLPEIHVLIILEGGIEARRQWIRRQSLVQLERRRDALVARAERVLPDEAVIVAGAADHRDLAERAAEGAAPHGLRIYRIRSAQAWAPSAV